MAAWLSHCTGIGMTLGTFSSDSNLDNQASSDVSLLKDLYSASAEESETVCYFLDFHDIKLSPSMTIKPLTDFLEFGQAAQSASQNASKANEGLELKNRPWAGSFLTYLKTWIAASQWGTLGADINWLKSWTQNDKSGLVWVRKLSFPTNFLYWEGSGYKKPWSEYSLTLRSKGVTTGERFEQSNSENNSLVNFYWVMIIPSGTELNSKPRK